MWFKLFFKLYTFLHHGSFSGKICILLIFVHLPTYFCIHIYSLHISVTLYCNKLNITNTTARPFHYLFKCSLFLLCNFLYLITIWLTMYLIHRLLESRHLLQLQLFLLLLGSTALLFGEVILFAMLLSTKSLVASGAYVITIFDTLLFWFFLLCYVLHQYRISLAIFGNIFGTRFSDCFLSVILSKEK